MKTAIATVSIAGDLAEKLGAIAAAGFDGVEIFENDFLAFDRSPKEVGQLVRDHGLEICLFQPFRDFEGMPEPQRSRTFERAKRKFELMREMGADLLLICSSVSPIALGGIDRAAADLNELGDLAATFDIRIGYEALAWGRFVNDHRDAWEIVRRADHAHVGLILDSFHTLSRKTDPDTIRAIPGDKIFFVQLADAPAFNMDLLYWSRHFRNMPGEGDLDVTGFMRAVAATGYDGVLSLEIFNDQFRGGSPKSIAVDGYRSLLYLMDQVRRTEPGIRIPVPDMPDRVPVGGIEFVEFAADRREARDLTAMLATLGFKRSARHVSKEVELWRQGGINIVINTDPRGFAHASYLSHGTNVCDIGLKVADAAATVARAESLGAKTFEQPVGPGELKIPAIRALGGSVLHFIDGSKDLSRVWETEFTYLNDDTATRAAGLTRIDHIAETMNYDEMLTWLLFYRSIFDTDKTAMVDVIDPAGLVRSQAIENADGTLRITLNGAENRKTLAGHFIQEGFGSGVQHIAFETADIFETVKALKANGFKPLAISPNYYDDLDARFGLEEDFLNALKSAGILYDRDETGEYFQLYSPTYGEGFFFEIVERRGGYKGYGAANAQFRIAAQKRHFRAKGMPVR
ncbi:bifunctional sugar phosphate isomerase/epimerase/4-hydroxyphenylpyruvate dioxygenase family protein [Roseibium sediminicola]|uniref:3-dehydroshikimate dehydratase n=1 Tax=Roseibium sediminicola TaxID=2933272 RepID=A0ABT0GTA8_9HYPH|nr:sugar phosphate isomerase/epimerase and 4-hydroxyphenylpyruvate domain-containing protein [Roseibium sp. CAU 1639]MCK7612681.1 sugar phosphate isomerase/epimerase and 4-hydroxyphenylpyruvate domain-containing protein [Roseibium sp. CAU 1639]